MRSFANHGDGRPRAPNSIPACVIDPVALVELLDARARLEHGSDRWTPRRTEVGAWPPSWLRETVGGGGRGEREREYGERVRTFGFKKKGSDALRVGRDAPGSMEDAKSGGCHPGRWTQP